MTLPRSTPAEAGQAVVGGLLVGQAALLCWLEELLYAGEPLLMIVNVLLLLYALSQYWVSWGSCLLR